MAVVYRSNYLEEHLLPSIQECVLSKVKMRFTNKISGALLSEIRMGHVIDSLSDTFIIGLEAAIFKTTETIDTVLEESKKIVKEEPMEFKTPSTWFQAFKEEYYPRWLLKKYPVQYTITKFIHKTYIEQRQHIDRKTISRSCPHINAPAENDHIRWIVYGEKPI